jgi:electron transfer flavoprotein beta subunit
MKIVVAIKQVPARDSQLSIASSGMWIEEADLTGQVCASRPEDPVGGPM